jgi:uncharacterized protein
VVDETRAGRVLRLHRYPLKSADGETLDSVEVGPAGLAEDRRWSLARPDGAAVTAKEVPALRSVRATVVSGRLHVEPPLAEVVGEPVDVVDAPGAHQQVAAVHLVSDGAAGDPDAPAGCDPEPRANVVLSLGQPGAERSWTGRRVRVGDAELRVTRTPARCLGVYAEVLVPGTVRVGDDVELLP